jgi:hypothetical protein
MANAKPIPRSRKHQPVSLNARISPRLSAVLQGIATEHETSISSAVRIAIEMARVVSIADALGIDLEPALIAAREDPQRYGNLHFDLVELPDD